MNSFNRENAVREEVRFPRRPKNVSLASSALPSSLFRGEIPLRLRALALGPLGFLLSLFLAAPAFADGGVVLSQQVAGPWRVTLFGSPAPLRAGPVDISVLLQDAKTGAPVLDQAVSVQIAAKAGESRSKAWMPPCCSMKMNSAPVPATHAAAQNKLLYAANLLVAASGPHEIHVRVGNDSAHLESLAAPTMIEPPAPPLRSYWAYLAFPPLVIAGFALNQRIRRRHV